MNRNAKLIILRRSIGGAAVGLALAILFVVLKPEIHESSAVIEIGRVKPTVYVEKADELLAALAVKYSITGGRAGGGARVSEAKAVVYGSSKSDALVEVRTVGKSADEALELAQAVVSWTLLRHERMAAPMLTNATEYASAMRDFLRATNSVTSSTFWQQSPEDRNERGEILRARSLSSEKLYLAEADKSAMETYPSRLMRIGAVEASILSGKMFALMMLAAIIGASFVLGLGWLRDENLANDGK